MVDPRPCPWTRCRYHLGDFENATETCALDVAAEGEHTFTEIGQLVGLSHARIGQIHERALQKLKRGRALRILRDA